MKLLIAILCGNERTNWLCPALVDWALGGKTPVSIEAEISLVSGFWPVDHARNVCVERATKSRADWLLMMDNDSGPGPEILGAIEMADQRGLDIVGFLYPMLTEVGVFPNVFAGEVANPKHDKEFREASGKNVENGSKT